MKISILGTGMVGQNLALAFAAKGHDIMIGTRDPAASVTNTAPNAYGQPGFGTWYQAQSGLELGSYHQAMVFGEIIINATNGLVTLEVLKQGQADKVGSKILIDVANKLQPVAGGMPMALANDEGSLGEEIQTAFPNLRVVKSLSTMNTHIMGNPALVAGDSSVFIAGNDSDAKAVTRALLVDFGWTDIIDLGDIKGARGVEMMMAIWLRLWGVIGNTPFNFKIVR
jgi:8-hydroxy-5-deazaflavin:NADPH oxidoreductase